MAGRKRDNKGKYVPSSEYTKTVAVRVSDDLYTALNKLAHQENLTATEYVRRMLEEATSSLAS
jgi:predicted DNA-binding protein